MELSQMRAALNLLEQHVDGLLNGRTASDYFVLFRY
jgi:hypothetical protein